MRTDGNSRSHLHQVHALYARGLDRCGLIEGKGGVPTAQEKETYPAEFRRRMVELVRTGRSPESLAKEFEPSANTIRKLATQADIDEGLRADGLTTAERYELRDLRREEKQLKLEREILEKDEASLVVQVRTNRPLGSNSHLRKASMMKVRPR